MTMIPKTLLDAIREQRVVLFLGAGASLEAKNSTNGTMPDGRKLAKLLADQFLDERYHKHDLMSVAEIAISQRGSIDVYSFIRSFMRDFKPTIAHQLIPTFRWKALCTTNYDLLIEDAFRSNSTRLQNFVTMVKDDDPVDKLMSQVSDALPLYKLHGCLDSISDNDIPLVLTSESYIAHSMNRRRLFDRVADLMFEYPFVFCGYSFRDLHIQELLMRVSKEKRPFSYIVTPSFEPEEKALWMSRRIEPISATFTKFMQSLDKELLPLLRKPAFSASTTSNPVRRHYRTNDHESDLLRSALSRDIEHVHADVDASPQTAADFYSGSDRGWHAIRVGYDVQRRAVTQLIEHAVLDKQDGFRLYLFSGAGGFGKTVALRRSAWEFATSLDQFTIWLRPGGRLSLDAIEELISLTGKRINIFVDRAAMNVQPIISLANTASTRNWPVSIITAERPNEWNIYCSQLEKFVTQEFEIERLSRSEIEALIAKLSDHECLGALQSLSHDQRIQLFIDQLDRQLLVVLHEVTRGKSFEEIVHDEYTRIVPDMARQLYLDICTLNQFSVPVRAGFISRLSGIRFPQFESDFFKPLEALVHVYQHPVLQDYVYSARHSRVAEMVFVTACSSDDDRSEQLRRIIAALDIGYSSDLEALSGIVRGRDIADSFQDIEKARQVYHLAETVAPNAAFVRQQRAISEYVHPSGSMVLAAEAADEARQLAPTNASVIHTQAEVARRAAVISRNSYERIALRRLARRYISDLPARDNRFGVSTSAKLLTDELEELLSEIDESSPTYKVEELAEKISSTEKVIGRGLQLYPNEPDLLQTEARLRELTGDTPKATSLLEKAWRQRPRGSGIALRLARIYEANGPVGSNIEILREALKREPNDRFVHYELGRALLRAEPSQQKEGAIHLSKSFVKNDKNHEARFLYACYLYLTNKFDEALDLFRDIERSSPVEFRPRILKSDPWLSTLNSSRSGRIGSKLGTYCFIKTALHKKDIYAPENRSDPDMWDGLHVDQEVYFDLDFGRKGPIAVRLREIS